jgi:nucleoside-diphosphate-sugar epimerase
MDEMNRFAGVTVLVTGASGFIGSHLCRHLLREGARVHAVSRERHGSDDERLQWWQADLGQVAAVRELWQATRPEIVFHLASHVAGARELGKVLPTFYDNLASTVHLLTAATERGCRRLVVSNSSEEPQRFDAETVPCSPYAAAKWSASAYGRMFHALYQTPVVMPRIFMTYGPDQKDVQKLVPYVIRALHRNQTPTLGSGTRRVDWIFVEDVVEGLLRAATAPAIEGMSFDLGSGRLLSIRQMVEQIVKVMESDIELRFGGLPDRPLEQERAADTTFLRERLGWTPQTSLGDGLEATVRWYCPRDPAWVVNP